MNIEENWHCLKLLLLILFDLLAQRQPTELRYTRVDLCFPFSHLHPLAGCKQELSDK